MRHMENVIMMFNHAVNACSQTVIFTMYYFYFHKNNTVTSLSNNFAIT